MQEKGLWKYCTPPLCREYLLSLKLFGEAGWTEEEQIACLYAVSNHMDSHYRLARIPKRDGSFRKLYIPDPLLKMLQRNILHHILEGLPISSCAAAYRKGAGIVENAAAHAGKRQILKLDILDFFGNILFPMVQQSVFTEKLFPPQIGMLLTSLCCYGNRLPQGAPASPAISNLVMRPFDEYMGSWCGERGIVYSRYCDDMTFSGAFDSQLVKRKVSAFLREMGFQLNEQKTGVIPAHRRQCVTGIVVNCRPQVSGEYRKKLRQELYYCKKFGVASHLARLQEKQCDINTEELKRYRNSLLGRINFVLQVNPGDTYFLTARKELQNK